MNARQSAIYILMYCVSFVIMACTPQASSHLPAIDSNQEGGKVAVRWLLMHNDGMMSVEIVSTDFHKDESLEHRGAWRISKQSNNRLKYKLRDMGTYHAQVSLDGVYSVNLNPEVVDHNVILVIKSGCHKGYWQFISDAGVEDEGELFLKCGL